MKRHTAFIMDHDHFSPQATSHLNSILQMMHCIAVTKRYIRNGDSVRRKITTLPDIENGSCQNGRHKQVPFARVIRFRSLTGGK